MPRPIEALKTIENQLHSIFSFYTDAILHLAATAAPLATLLPALQFLLALLYRSLSLSFFSFSLSLFLSLFLSLSSFSLSLLDLGTKFKSALVTREKTCIYIYCIRYFLTLYRRGREKLQADTFTPKINGFSVPAYVLKYSQ